MSTPNIVWLKNGRVLKQVDDTIRVIDTLPKRVYTMNFDPDRHEIFLEDFADEFHFNFKIYGMESKLIEHIMTTFENTTSNLGILFNGVKGTGKTITAKIIANKTKLPVILINAPYPGLTDFISKINSPCVLFFDEFEKNFNTDKGHDLELLSIMDGVFNSPYRRVFLLTTNKLHINENFIGRPSRIRYKKSFGNLSTDVIMEYLNDCLEDKSRVQEVLSFIDSLAISTIDILKSVVEELNIHKCSINDFKSFINVEQAKYFYSVQYTYYGLDEENSIPIFRDTLSKIGTKDKDSDGKEHTLDEDDLSIYRRKINSAISAEFLRVGDPFGGFGSVIEPLTVDGILVTETSEGEKCYFKILNLENRPSLYRGGLAL